MGQIFFSYASENRHEVDVYVDAFRGLGLDVWIDHGEIRHGDSIVELLNKALRECRFAVVFFSQHYEQKPWTNEEQRALIYAFVESNQNGMPPRRLFVIRLDQTELPPMLGHRLWRGAGDARALGRAILEQREDRAPSASPASSASEPRRRIEDLPHRLDGIALEQLATQLLSLRDRAPASDPIELPAFINGYGRVRVECMPPPASTVVIEDMATALHVCQTHRRIIGSHQKSLARQGLGIFDEPFRIALDEEIERLDRARFGDRRRPGLRECLNGLILEAWQG